jgi:serine protease SohB
MQFWLDYGLFIAKTVTIVLAIGVVIGQIGGLIARQRGVPHDRLIIRKLNKKFRRMALAMQRELLPPKALKQLVKAEHALDKKPTDAERKRVYVLDFHGDIRASQVASLREEVTAILTVVRPGDQVMVRLESPGGMVHSYGLAASQLARLRDKGVSLTVAVDKIAASGGYMMACVADHIVAAPFAVLGSIGVVAQVPNLHRLLKKHDIDYELYTAGAWKRTVTMFGENNDAGRDKFRLELEEAHSLFKDFVHTYRNGVDLELVATGEHWYGQRAHELRLCDQLGTSDDWLLAASHEAELLEVRYVPQRHWNSRISRFAAETLDRVVGVVLQRANERTF